MITDKRYNSKAAIKCLNMVKNKVHFRYVWMASNYILRSKICLALSDH